MGIYNSKLEEYLLLQFKDIPFLLFVVSLLIFFIIVVLTFLLRKRRRTIWHSVLSITLIEYIFLMLCSTVICRGFKDNSHIEFMPFWNYHNVLNVNKPYDYWEVLLNIFLYSPIGFLLGCLYKRLLPTIMICILLSVVTEVSQYVLHRGLCETDDVIHNTLGGMFGWTLYFFLRGRFVKLMRLRKR